MGYAFARLLLFWESKMFTLPVQTCRLMPYQTYASDNDNHIENITLIMAATNTIKHLASH